MKTIIFYATKHGAAAEIARLIAAQIEGAVTHNLKEANAPPLADFDCVVVGSSIYAGAFRKEAKSFLVENADELRGKTLGLFVSGLGGGDAYEPFNSNVPVEVLQAAVVAKALGGIFDPKKTNFFERLIIRIVTKDKDYVNTISDNNNRRISRFADAIKTGKHYDNNNPWRAL